VADCFRIAYCLSNRCFWGFYFGKAYLYSVESAWRTENQKATGMSAPVAVKLKLIAFLSVQQAHPSIACSHKCRDCVMHNVCASFLRIRWVEFTTLPSTRQEKLVFAYPRLFNHSLSLSVSQVLITSLASTQPLLAVATPKCIRSMSSGLWASVLMLSGMPSSMARRA
jgi:hypothetical protein